MKTKSAKNVAKGIWVAMLAWLIGSGCASWRQRVSGESWTQRAAQEDQGRQTGSEPGASW